MDKIRQGFTQALWHRHGFITVLYPSVALLCVIFYFVYHSAVLLVFAALFMIGFLIKFLLFQKDRKKCRKFLSSLSVAGEVRSIDTAFFSESEMIAYSMDSFVASSYSQIEFIRPEGSVFEHVWDKKYKGIHQLYCETKNGAVLVSAESMEKIHLLAEFLLTKNPQIRLIGDSWEMKSRTLQDIGDWQTKTRFH